MVAEDVIVANCLAAGYSEAAVREELTTLVASGELCEADGHYARATEPEDESLDIKTHRGDDSTPWQFSVKRTSDEIIITQARGPPEKFDPVVKRFTIEDCSLGAQPVEFHHAVTRRVWQEDPANPHVRSQRSEGHIIEFLYRDPDGWHLARPDPPDYLSSGGEATYEPTGHPGLTVSATFLRAEEEDEVKFTEERDYRVAGELLDAYAAVYVLAYHEVNEESVENAEWAVENAVAHRLVSQQNSDTDSQS